MDGGVAPNHAYPPRFAFGTPSMPSLGTNVIAPAGDAASGQEGYNHGPSEVTASTTAESDARDNDNTALPDTAIALQDLNIPQGANNLCTAAITDAGDFDGAREFEGKVNAASASPIESVIGDSPAHDYHVHTEAANAKHAAIKQGIADLEKDLDIMSDERPAAAGPAVALDEQRNSLDELEKTGPGETSTIARTLSTDEKPDSATSSPAAASGVPLPDSVASSPESAHSASTPALNITLLLPTGARHAFRITESYLTKRGVSIPGNDDKGNKDVYSVSVYQIKELILREWKEEWGGEAGRREGSGDTEGSDRVEGQMRGKPSSPAAIRLIFFGRLLGDGDKVEDCRFNKATANVVHMTVRPQDVVDEEETERKRNEGRSSTRRSRRSGSGSAEQEETPGCRCVIL